MAGSIEYEAEGSKLDDKGITNVNRLIIILDINFLATIDVRMF